MAEIMPLQCNRCTHGPKWHHDTDGCGYHGHGPDQCPCVLDCDAAARSALTDDAYTSEQDYLADYATVWDTVADIRNAAVRYPKDADTDEIVVALLNAGFRRHHATHGTSSLDDTKCVCGHKVWRHKQPSRGCQAPGCQCKQNAADAIKAAGWHNKPTDHRLRGRLAQAAAADAEGPSESDAARLRQTSLHLRGGHQDLDESYLRDTVARVMDVVADALDDESTTPGHEAHAEARAAERALREAAEAATGSDRPSWIDSTARTQIAEWLRVRADRTAAGEA